VDLRFNFFVRGWHASRILVNLTTKDFVNDFLLFDFSLLLALVVPLNQPYLKELSVAESLMSGPKHRSFLVNNQVQTFELRTQRYLLPIAGLS